MRHRPGIQKPHSLHHPQPHPHRTPQRPPGNNHLNRLCRPPGPAWRRSPASRPPAPPRHEPIPGAPANPAHTAELGHDLHRRGLRSGPDLTQKRAYIGAPYGLLAPRHQTPTPQYQRKLTSIFHNPRRRHESGLMPENIGRSDRPSG